MLCKVDYSRSQVREYKDRSNEVHKYLDLFFIPAQMDILEQSFDQGTTMFRIQFFPQRNADNTVNTVHEEALVQLFLNKNIPNKHVGSVEVEVAPHWRSFGQTAQGRTPGELIKNDDGTNRVFTSVTVSTLMTMENGVEKPNRPMSYYESRARNLRKARIEQTDTVGKWYEITQINNIPTTHTIVDDGLDILDEALTRDPLL